MGFFTAAHTTQTGSKSTPLKVIPGTIPHCGSCGLFRQCESPKMKPSGEGTRKILIVGEAPGCISGDSLIDVAYQDKTNGSGVPIKDLVGQSGFKVYSFSIKENKHVLGTVSKVWKTGTKKVYRVTYEWYFAKGRNRIRRTGSLLVTKNHKFLLKQTKVTNDPFGGPADDRKYLSIENGLSVGHSLQPFHHRLKNEYYFIGASSKTMEKESRFLLSAKIGRNLTDAEECHHINENKVDDSEENLQLETTQSHAKIHASTRPNPMDRVNGRENHRRAVTTKEYRDAQSKFMKKHLTDPVVYAKRVKQIRRQAGQTSKTVKALYETPGFYQKYLRGRQKMHDWKESEVRNRFLKKFPNEEFPFDNHIITKIECVGRMDVFDMEVAKYHNFAANGVFVHNSQEDRRGEQFVGDAGQLLRKHLEFIKVDIDDCWKDNSIRCRPPANKIEDKYIRSCRPNLTNAVRELKPNVIILLGLSAVKSAVAADWTQEIGTMARWAGQRIPSPSLNAWLCPTYHPSYVMRENENPALVTIFRKQLKAAFALEDVPPTPFDLKAEERKYELITNPRLGRLRMKDLAKKKGAIAFDYETTGLKPEHPDQEIYTSSFCYEGEDTFACRIDESNHGALKRILLNPDLAKVGQNMKFEHRWSKAKLDVQIAGWLQDAMLVSHCLNNVSGVTSIKFQSYVRLGVPTYNETVARYLKAKHPNSLNRIKEAPILDVLRYNCSDALLEYKIAKIQRDEYPIE